MIKKVSFVVFAQVQNLTHGQIGHEGQVVGGNAIRPPAPSPIKLKQKGKKEGPIQNNLQLLRETQKFRNNLKEDDISWEIWVSLQDHVSFDTALTTGKQLYSCFNHRMIFPFTRACPRVQMDLNQCIIGIRKLVVFTTFQIMIMWFTLMNFRISISIFYRSRVYSCLWHISFLCSRF